MSAVDDVRQEAEAAQLRKLVRPDDHQWTRQEVDKLSTAEFEVNEPGILAAMREGRIS